MQMQDLFDGENVAVREQAAGKLSSGHR